MTIKENYPLKKLNSFGIESTAKFYSTFSNVEELTELLSNAALAREKLLVLGGGSNVLFTTSTIDYLVLQNLIMGIEIVAENEKEVYLKSGAGESWHSLVEYAVGENLGGLENLSLIPGTVGAAPIQNIGAYGVELKDSFVSLEAFEIDTQKVKTFGKEECKFGYRSSFFKYEAKGKYIITSVTFRLQKKPTFNISYGAVSETLDKMGNIELSVKAISEAVISIRKSKLPDPNELGNAGSFFKNPEIPLPQFNLLRKKYSDIPSYPTTETSVKIPAGWLIEQCGWKGKQVGQTGVHKNQALVLVNYGGASGHEIKELAVEIQASVVAKFSIALEAEVNFI